LGRLHEVVEGLVELAEHVEVRWVYKADQLSAIYHLRQSAIEEGVLDIELMYWQGPERQSRNSLDGTRLDHRAEGLIIALPSTLGEAPQDPTSLVPIQGAIRRQLVLEDIFPSDHIGTRGV
jgi:hypothetical protein